MGGLILPVLTSCVTTRNELSWARKDHGIETVSRTSLWHCSGHGGRYKNEICMTDSEWGQVRAAFEGVSPSDDGADERERLRHAIASLEDVVGAKTGTTSDVGGSFGGFSKDGQMDCVDEMLNVATYLDLLIKEGLVTKHRLGRRYTNQFFKTGGWPHTATSIVDLETGAEFIVDSWWLKNGSLPFVVPVEQWTEGEWDRPMSKRSKRAAESASTLAR